MDENYEASVDERLKRLMVATRGRSLTADDSRVTILPRDCYTHINDGGLERAGESPQYFNPEEVTKQIEKEREWGLR